MSVELRPKLNTPPRRTVRVRPAWLAIASGILLLGWMSQWELSSGPAQGEGFRPPKGESPSIPSRWPNERSFRVANFNIHQARGQDGITNLDRIAECVSGFDLVGLNEVNGGAFWSLPSQAHQLGDRQQMNWLFAPTEWCWLGEHFGSGALSRMPVQSWQRIPFPKLNGNGHRNYLLIKIPLFKGEETTIPFENKDGSGEESNEHLTVIVTHLDRRGDRIPQLAEVIELFLELPEPAILMGDLNTTSRDPGIQKLFESPDVVDCITQYADSSIRNRIDWIFARGLNCLEAGIESTTASDHPLVWAELRLESR